MTNIELTLNQLAEVTTTSISKAEQPQTVEQNKKVAKRGGDIVKNTRLEIEKEIKQKVISPLNAKNKPQLEINPK
jgi:spermidine/putrescine-binding protein